MNKSVLTTLLLCLCAVLGAQAQVDGGNWYDGEIVYSASQKDDGKVRMHAMDEGEELEFWLIPIADKKDTYRITRDPNSQDYEYHDVVKVRHLKEKDLDVLCFYTKNNGLQTVMSNEKEWDAEKINKAKWLQQFYGYFVAEEESEFEKELRWNSSKLTVNGTELPYDVITFNGRITDFIRIYDVEDSKNEVVNEFVGTWKVIPNREGFELISVNDESDNMPYLWEPDGPKYQFSMPYNYKSKGRFDYANYTLLNDKQFAKMDKKSLRFMRNEILAYHGYSFQSKDLRDFFNEEPWYHPASSNDQIELSLLEQLNIELIKYVENTK